MKDNHDFDLELSAILSDRMGGHFNGNELSEGVNFGCLELHPKSLVSIGFTAGTLRSQTLIIMFNKLSLFLAIITFSTFLASAQTPSITKTELSPAEIDRILKKTTENEGAFREALSNYVFDRSATVQTIGMGGQITGTYRRDSFLTFTQDGNRFERITFAPVSTLTEIDITPQDLEDLGGVNPFALEPRNFPLYKFSFLGKEKIDELDLYVFEVEPKVMPDPKRHSFYFRAEFDR